MEIKRSKLGVEEGIVKVEDSKLSNPFIHNDLVSKDLHFMKMPDFNDNFMMKIQPSQLFDNLEEEYSKVKDFNFRNVDVEKIKKHVMRV
jgi:hypothetical protein